MLICQRSLLLAALLTVCSSALAMQVLGIDLDVALESDVLGASRDGAPDSLTLQLSPALPDSPAAAQGWTAAAHWWYAKPLELPARLQGRNTTLQIAIDGARRPFWLLLRLAAADCQAERDWFGKALSARYELDAPNDAAAATVPELAQHYRNKDGAMLISLHCEAQQLQLEYLLPERFLSAYERTLKQHHDRNADDQRRTAMDAARATLLAEQSELLLRAKEGSLISWLGMALNTDGVYTAEPGVETAFRPDRLGSERIEDHGLLPGATHTLEVDIAGGITRMTTLVPDPDNALQQRWRTLLRARFGRPGKDAEQHQIYRFGPQRLVLRPQHGLLRIAYQNLDRRRAERDRLAAQKAEAFAESIKGL